MFGNKKPKNIKRVKPVETRASYDDFRQVEKTVTMSGDMIAVLQNFATLSIHQKGAKQLIEDTSFEAFTDTMSMLSQCITEVFTEVGLPLPSSVPLKDMM